ncbi:unnamed protein product [Heterosigma akashiwo]|mmetsp:Transcript_25312/g.42282  ORF Transcript_25312/g.42282 Transcript_25312/m.42282 type:complete len:197 (+) Transcript_25312:3-593(+)
MKLTYLLILILGAFLPRASAGPLGGVWNSYNKVLSEKPILTKACTSLVGFSVGDVLAQKLIDKADKLDVPRIARLASFGFFIHGTAGHFFYGFLDSKFPGTDPKTVVTKVVIDQLLMNPVFATVFFTYLGLVSGDGPSKIINKIKNDLFAAVKGSWTVWPVAHLINFRFVPPEQRLLYINSIQIAYNVFLSFIGNK